MKYLLVVDLQREFAKGPIGKHVYAKSLRYIYDHQADYDAIYAAFYVNDTSQNENMIRLVGWTEMMDEEELSGLQFPYNYRAPHTGYAIPDYPGFTKEDTVDILGFDTDACVLNACFDIFNLGCKMRILIKYVYSSGGMLMHLCGKMCMRRQFKKALCRK